MVDRLAARLLGRHRAIGAEDGVAAGQRLVGGGEELLGDPEVGDLRPSARGDQHVLGLEVAVDDPLPVRLVEPAGQVARERQGLRDRQAPAFGQLAQVGPLDVLHDDVVEVLRGEDVVDLDDRRVVEPRRHPCLAAEALAPPRADPGVGADALHRHPAVEAVVVGEEHLPHAAGAEPL